MSPSAFAWDRALLATLRHSTLPFNTDLELEPLTQNPGARERLSLVAQFAAHQAFLQFASIADGELVIDEWRVARKRGSDCRLVRIAARRPDPSTAPPVLSLIHQFADAIEAPPLDVLRQSWARAESVYAEVHRRLRDDIAADSRWMQSAAAGSILAPGPEALAQLWSSHGRYECDDTTALRAGAIILGGGSPLRRYSSLDALVPLIGAFDALSESEVAERAIARFDERHLIFIVEELFDAASKRVVDMISNVDGATWIMPGGTPLPASKHFVVTQHLGSQRVLESKSWAWIESLVTSPAYAALLDRDQLPPEDIPIAEPHRSYLGALSLLGTRIPCDVAKAFLAEFLFTGELDELLIDGLTSIETGTFVLACNLAHLVPETSKSALYRVAAEKLERFKWSSAEETVRVLRALPQHALTEKLTEALASALIDRGKYSEARAITTNPLLIAKCERRTGDYESALARLDAIEHRDFDAALLRAELLFVEGRYDEAMAALRECEPFDEEQRARLSYQLAILANEAGHSFAGRIEDPYWLARHATYRAIRHRNVDAALQSTAKSLELATTIPDRIDVSLDRVFVLFTAGRWRETRAEAMSALALVEETEGDRAAGGILFTLAYLAADDGQWVHASHHIERLRHFYAGVGDSRRLRELDLLTAHLDFSRGRFERARIAASAALEAELSSQMIEAANLILDEIDLIEGLTNPLRSTGRTPNVELARRHKRLLGTEPDATPLEQFRTALAKNDRATAERLARELGIEIEMPSSTTSELHVLRAAATRDFPFGAHDLGAVRWRFATRNRLGHWNEIGSLPPFADYDHALQQPDWIACSDRELLYIDGLSSWSAESRDAIAALFQTKAENHRLRRLLEHDEPPPSTTTIEGVIGDSPAMHEVYSTITRVAKRDVAVCVLGESGTGKELAARAIHRHSTRRQKVFTAVNCAALPENLIESELFGHIRGAFTGADRDRAGLIETTDGGTLFLDEIGEMPLTAQAKLLRFLQEGEFRRVGDTVNRTADVRIVSATNRKLDAAVEEGRFREDLYYRVRGVEVALPPLRERGSDILLLASHFLAAEREKHRTGASAFTPDVEAILASYSWPGNVRELQNTIRAAHALAGEGRAIDVEHLPERLRKVSAKRVVAGSYQEAVARFRRELIEKSLAAANGNQNQAAALLKMSRQALAYQIRELGILVRM
ncbi:MAG TPA: sigma 54-interacting transcriptional regulator [Thermoanaerobaculia bacterium]|nr:sigma 54-interacting transcriptional regulator [Thermoanaerobaculia bacterium]